MNKKRLVWLLAVEALVCLGFIALQVSTYDVFTTVVAFPFEPIGWGLRQLSLWSGIGNVIAIILYLAICLIPCGILLIMRRKGELHIEDGLLAVISGLLFFVMHQMINPGLIQVGAWGDSAVGKAVLCGTVYSVLCAYGVLRALRLFSSGNGQKLQTYMMVLLGIMSGAFVLAIFGGGVQNLLVAVDSLLAGNAGNENLLFTTYVFLGLQFLADNLPFALNIWVAFGCISLLQNLLSNPYGEETVLSADRLCRICKRSLGVMVLVGAGFNFLQLIFAGQLHVINTTVVIPLFSIIFVLAVLMMSRFIYENKALNDDIERFI